MASESPSFDLDKLPPVIQLLLREVDSANPKDDPLKRLKKLRPELQRQAEWSMDKSDYYLDWMREPNLTASRIALVEGLDPLSTEAKCAHGACRVATAEQICRSIGLYANRMLVFDSLTDYVFLTEDWNDRAYTRLGEQWLVLLTLRPLLEAGVFEFVNPFLPMCSACHTALNAKVEELTSTIFDEVKSDLSVKIEDNWLLVNTDLLGTSMTYRGVLSRRDRNIIKRGSLDKVVARKWAAPHITTHVAATLGMLKAASRAGAITCSNSRIGLMAAREVDGNRPAYRDTKRWETARSAALPWVGDLTMSQIVQLRKEADSALPRFREVMSRLMLAENIGHQDSAQQIASELRDEALEVEAELRALRLPSRSRVQKALAALTVVVYGCAAESVSLAATTGLAALLHHLHRSHARDAQEFEGLLSKPGYVLAKAKELVGHAERR